MPPKKSIKAVQSEAEHSPHIIEIRGEKFGFKRISDWPAKSFETIDQGHLFTPIAKALVDYETDYERLDALDPTLGELGKVFEDLSKAEGMGGNS